MIPTITTDHEFGNWLKAGPRICAYHIGHLADDRYRKANEDLGPLARAVWAAAVNRDERAIQLQRSILFKSKQLFRLASAGL